VTYRKLRELKPMKDKIETITAMDFRRQPGEILDSVALGKTFIVTKQGKPCAVLQPLPGERLTIVVRSDGSMDYGV
jgi:prevent-host-death family protein